VDAFNDLTHGVFVDPNVAALWRDHYLVRLRLDLSHLNRDAIDAARQHWRAR
jgi:hypothetical protein